MTSTALTPSTHTLLGQPLLPTGSTLLASAMPSTLPLTQPPPLLQHLPIQTPLTLSNPSRPGLILSPACDPIPQSIVQRVQSGQFVEMRDLLADIALMGQLSSLHGTLPLPPTTIQGTRLREVLSLASWMYCFVAYVAIRTPGDLTCRMLAYARLIIREALRHGGTGWAEYDRVSGGKCQSTQRCPGTHLSRASKLPLFLANALLTGCCAPYAKNVTTQTTNVLWPHSSNNYSHSHQLSRLQHHTARQGAQKPSNAYAWRGTRVPVGGPSVHSVTSVLLAAGHIRHGTAETPPDSEYKTVASTINKKH